MRCGLVPAVLESSTALRWSRSGRWSAAALAEALAARTLEIKRSHERRFMYIAESRRDALLPDGLERPELVQIGASDFFGAAIERGAPP